MLPWTHQLSIVLSMAQWACHTDRYLPAQLCCISSSHLYFTDSGSKVGSHSTCPDKAIPLDAEALRLASSGYQSWVSFPDPLQICSQVPWRNYRVIRGKPWPAWNFYTRGTLQEAEWLLPLGMVCGQESPGYHISVCSPLISRELSNSILSSRISICSKSCPQSKSSAKCCKDCSWVQRHCQQAAIGKGVLVWFEWAIF